MCVGIQSFARVTSNFSLLTHRIQVGKYTLHKKANYILKQFNVSQTFNNHLPILYHYCTVVVVVFTLKAVPISTQYFLTSVLVQLTRTPSSWSQANYPERVHISERNKRTQKSQHTRDNWKRKYPPPEKVRLQTVRRRRRHDKGDR